jgi:hypothetical protein
MEPRSERRSARRLASVSCAVLRLLEMEEVCRRSSSMSYLTVKMNLITAPGI